MLVVSHLLVERGVDEVVPAELGERERFDRPVLHRSRAELTGELDAQIARLHAAEELTTPEVLPHQPEVVLLEPHGIVPCFEPLPEPLAELGSFRTADEAQRCRLDLERELLVAHLVGESAGLLDVGAGYGCVVRPVVGKPDRGKERFDHRPAVALLGRELVRLLVGGSRQRGELLVVERAHVVCTPEGEQDVELGGAITSRSRGREHRLEVGRGSLAVEQVEEETRPLAQDRVVRWTGRSKRSAPARSLSASSICAVARWARACMREQLRTSCLVAITQEMQRRTDVADRVLRRDRRERVASCVLEEVERRLARRGRTGELQVMRDVRRVPLRVGPEQRLHRGGNPHVKALAPGNRQVGKERLADLLVHERIERIAPSFVRFDQGRAFRLLERVQQLILLEPSRGEQELETGAPSGDGGRGERPAGGVADPFESALDDQTYGRWHIGVSDRDPVAPATVLIEQEAELLQVEEHLFDEERVALGLVEHQGDELVGGAGRPARPSSSIATSSRESAPRRTSTAQAPAGQVLERPRRAGRAARHHRDGSSRRGAAGSSGRAARERR